MISRIVSLSPQAPAGYAPLLAGASPSIGTPVLLGYELSGAACGALAADCFEDSVTLRWLCVDSACQHHGIAGQLLDTLCTLVADAGAVRIDAAVCLTGEKTAPLEALLTRRRFVRLEESPVFSFPLSAVLEGPLAPLIARKDVRAVHLHSLPQYLLRELKHLAADYDDLNYQAADFDGLLPESLAWLEGGAVTGCILLAPCGDGVELRWLHAKGAAAVQGLVAGAAGAVAATHSPQTVIHAAAMTPSVDALIRKLAGSQLTVHPPVVRFSLELKP